MVQSSVDTYRPNTALRTAAKIISYIFHPLFFPTYVFYYLSQQFPYEFAGMDQNSALFRTVVVFINTAFFPAFAIFLLWRLKFIDSIFLKTKKERIIPYILVMFFYWWVWYLSKNFTDQPLSLRVFYLGIFLATVPALIINNFIKISMHALGCGGVVAFMVILALTHNFHLGFALSLSILLAGIICTSRFIVSDHTNKEIYSGFIIGVICQAIAAWVTF
jgi:hypothetical protein